MSKRHAKLKDYIIYISQEQSRAKTGNIINIDDVQILSVIKIPNLNLDEITNHFDTNNRD